MTSPRRDQPHDRAAVTRASRVLWAGGAAIAAALALPSVPGLARVDEAVREWAIAAQWEPVVVVARAFDALGSTVVTAPLMVAVGAWLALRRWWSELATWAGAMAASQLLIGPVKHLVERPRPPSPLVTTTSWSFPSGHVVASTAIAVALVLVLVPAGPRRRSLGFLAAAFVAAMSVSRVYLRAHWLTDVAAGVAIGAAVSLGASALVHLVLARRTTRV